MVAGFNGSFIVDMLKALDGDSVSLDFGTVKPLTRFNESTRRNERVDGEFTDREQLLVDVETDAYHYQHVVMPMRV